MAQLTGTGRLADDLYLMAHHELSGKPLLQPRAVSLGLAGALLAELILAGRVGVWADRIVVTGPGAPEDELAARVLGRLLSERDDHPVRDWLVYLGRTAPQEVARRLAGSGYLTLAAPRRWWRPARWVPVDADCAFAPMIRVQPALRLSGPVTVPGAVLAGLANACGLGPRMQLNGPPDTRNRLGDAVQQLGPDLRELIAQTQAAVDSALLAARV